MPNQGVSLLEEINRTDPPTPVLWWLGHCGFAIKYYDILFFVDPLLAAEQPFPASAVERADLILCTHADDEHMHADTLNALLNGSRTAKVVLPKSAADHANSSGIPYHRMTTTDSDLRIEYFKSGAYGRVYAVPSAHPELCWSPIGGYPCLGYLIRFGDCTIYHAGDSVPYEGLADRLRPYNVDVALMPVAGRDQVNFTVEEAAELANAIHARWLVPMHYGPSQGVAQRFLDHMLFHRPEQRFKIFEPGEGWRVPARDNVDA